jgi:hypothetical protein
MGKPIQIKDPATKENLYPITKPELVQDDNGNTVTELFPVKEGNIITSAYTKGGSNETKNYNEFACGRYNQSTKSTNNQLFKEDENCKRFWNFSSRSKQSA